MLITGISFAHPHHHRSKINSPVTNSKAHRISHNDDSSHAIATHILITINEIIHTERDADGVRKREESHGEDQTKPLDLVCGADTPEDQGARDDDDVCCEEPEALFGLHDTTVTACKFDC